MRTIFLTSLLLLSLTIFSQETYTMKSGGRIFNSKEERLNSTQVTEHFTQEALKYYKAGRSKKTLGNILFWGGAASIITNTILYYNQPIDYLDSNRKSLNNNKVTYTFFYIGGGLVLASIPIKLGFQNKIRKSVEIMNDYATKSDKASIESTNLLINQNGIGLSIQF